MVAASVLVVDDEPSVVKVVDLLLKQAGYHSLPALGAQKGLELARRERVDLLLSETHLEGMSGVELAREVASLWPQAKAVLMGSGSHAQLSGSEILRKPFSTRKLLDRIATALASSAPARVELRHDLRKTRALLTRQRQIISDIRQPEAQAADRARACPQAGKSPDSPLQREPEGHFFAGNECVALAEVAGEATGAATCRVQPAPVSLTHYTEDGPITLLVRHTSEGAWAASFSGEELEGLHRFITLAEANGYVRESFQSMFPNHRCDSRCGPISGDGPADRGAGS